jgi:hypothetical protein
MKNIAAFLASSILLLAGISFAGDSQFSAVKFLVLKDQNGKPVRNASIVLHPVDKDGRQQKGGMQLKTDSEGRTSFDGVPYGKLRIQVIAHGLQTYGDDFEINQPAQEVVIKLKPPQEQYSIYKK